MNRREALATLAAIPVSSIASVERVVVEPNQVIVIESTDKLSAAAHENITRAARAAFQTDRIIVFDRGLRLKTVRVVNE